MKHSILVIEDDDSIRRLLEYDLKQLGYDVMTSATGQEGLSLALEHNFDLIVIDWMLPGKSGIEVTKAYREAGRNAIVMMVTAKNSEEDLLDAFDSGVDDYMSKPFSPRELTARIKAHLRRIREFKKTRDYTFGNLKVDLDMHYVYIDDEKIDLTRKEFDLLIFLLQNIDKVLSRDEILSKIWNFEYDGDTRIVDVHIFKLRSKIQDANITIESLRGVGYVAKAE